MNGYIIFYYLIYLLTFEYTFTITIIYILYIRYIYTHFSLYYTKNNIMIYIVFIK